MRYKTTQDESFGTNEPEIQLVTTGGFDLPEIVSSDNLASRAVLALRDTLQAAPDFGDIIIRIEKNIPVQGGLGGASTNAAAALLGAALLGDVLPDDPALEQAARALGADVAFFLYGGCSFFEGRGDVFHHALKPAASPVVLLKPHAGVSTPLAYRAFDENPLAIDSALLETAQEAASADEVPLYNNLAPAAEELLPELRDIRLWAETQQGVTNTLLCGSGATTFAICDSIDATMRIVAEAKKHGLWARATSLSSIGVRAMNTGD